MIAVVQTNGSAGAVGIDHAFHHCVELAAGHRSSASIAVPTVVRSPCLMLAKVTHSPESGGTFHHDYFR
jgi:hypothetical protein